MFGSIGNFDGMVCFFLGMVGAAGSSSSFHSSCSSISSVSILVLVSFLHVTITRVVSYLATVVASSFSFVSFFFFRRKVSMLRGVMEYRCVVAWWLFLVSLDFGGITTFDTALLCWPLWL